MFVPQIPLNINGKDLVTDAISVEFQNRTLYISSEIDDNLATVVNSSLRYLSRVNNDDITIYINSPGGSVSSGFAIHDTIQAIGCDVTIVAEGVAASMAAFLLTCSGTKGKRYAMPNAEIMIHQPLGGVNGQATDISIAASHIMKIKNKINNMLSESTGQAIGIIEQDTERDTWLTAQEALAYGLIDKIIYSYEEDFNEH